MNEPSRAPAGSAPPAAAAASPAVPYIGSHISLISKSAIRYEGILYTIDTIASTVALQNVRSFGSEGRERPEGPAPPMEKVFEYIIFRGQDIMDLQVLRTTANGAQAVPYDDPAILSSGTLPPTAMSAGLAAVPGGPNGGGLTTPPPGMQAPPPPGMLPGNAHNAPGGQGGQPNVAPSAWGPPPTSAWGPPPAMVTPPQQTAAGQPAAGRTQKRDVGAASSNWRNDEADRSSARASAPNNGYRRDGGRDGGRRNGGGRDGPRDGARDGGRDGGRDGRDGGRNNARNPRGRRARRKGPGITVPAEDFDFESMHEKFDKVAVSESADYTQDAAAVGVKYDSSKGFFDELVPEKTMPRERVSAASRRATDMETFGEAGNNYGRYRNYRGRERRGGRGRRQGGYRNEGGYRGEGGYHRNEGHRNEAAN